MFPAEIADLSEEELIRLGFLGEGELICRLSLIIARPSYRCCSWYPGSRQEGEG